jgi:hypothetical protein
VRCRLPPSGRALVVGHPPRHVADLGHQAESEAVVRLLGFDSILHRLLFDVFQTQLQASERSSVVSSALTTLSAPQTPTPPPLLLLPARPLPSRTLPGRRVETVASPEHVGSERSAHGQTGWVSCCCTVAMYALTPQPTPASVRNSPTHVNTAAVVLEVSPWKRHRREGCHRFAVNRNWPGLTAPAVIRSWRTAWSIDSFRASDQAVRWWAILGSNQ